MIDLLLCCCLWIFHAESTFQSLNSVINFLWLVIAFFLKYRKKKDCNFFQKRREDKSFTLEQVCQGFQVLHQCPHQGLCQKFQECMTYLFQLGALYLTTTSNLFGEVLFHLQKHQFSRSYNFVA